MKYHYKTRAIFYLARNEQVRTGTDYYYKRRRCNATSRRYWWDQDKPGCFHTRVRVACTYCRGDISQRRLCQPRGACERLSSATRFSYRLSELRSSRPGGRRSCYYHQPALDNGRCGTSAGTAYPHRSPDERS